MSKLIPNARTWVAYVPTLASPLLIPTLGEIGTAIKLTPLLITLNASVQGNVIPTPDLAGIYETSGSGTTQATFTADFYRDDVVGTDLAWTTLPRATTGYILVSRTVAQPVVGTVVEVWPIIVTSRTPAALANNTAQTFTLTCSVPVSPVSGAVTATMLLRGGEEGGTQEAPVGEKQPQPEIEAQVEEQVEEPVVQPA